MTLQQLKRKPQFIDAVFAAKGNRTKMEEEPVLTVPDTEVKQDFIIPQKQEEDKAAAKGNDANADNTAAANASAAGRNADGSTGKAAEVAAEIDSFDLSDIKATPKEQSPEDIIAASMAEAYKE